jgi:hypothetical protein
VGKRYAARTLRRYFIFAGQRKTMKKLVTFLALPLCLLACTTITYKDGSAVFTRTSFGTQLQIMELAASTDEHGRRTVRLEGYTSDQVQALKAVAEGVAKGLSPAP